LHNLLNGLDVVLRTKRSERHKRGVHPSRNFLRVMNANLDLCVGACCTLPQKVCSQIQTMEVSLFVFPARLSRYSLLVMLHEKHVVLYLNLQTQKIFMTSPCLNFRITEVFALMRLLLRSVLQVKLFFNQLGQSDL
ncbi:MAG: hypothetical protein WCL33_06100, partial [Planctomycetota bacterium]